MSLLTRLIRSTNVLAAVGRERSRTRLALALCSTLSLVLSACAPDLPVDPPGAANLKFLNVTGSWSYSAWDIRLAGTAAPGPCTISGVEFRLDQIREAGAFSGRSTSGALSCTGALAFLSGPIIEYPVGNGYTFNEFVAFDLGTPDWRHSGYVATTDSVSVDSISGTFTLKNGGIDLEGTFRLRRNTHP